MDADKLKLEIRRIIPPLCTTFHKGQAGRVGIVGGSKNYTGAPYFAAISALKVGCDLSHVFCTQDASSVIKSYSPELIVHPILNSSDFAEEISVHLPYMHSLVIGPGLGRDLCIFDSTRHIIDLAKERSLPLVFDADALFYLNNNPGTISSHKRAILTPNKVEFGRLYNALTKRQMENEPTIDDVREIADLLGNVTIVKKGLTDIISDGINTVVCDEPGSPRRCGGQGDVLSGAMGTFSYWAHKFYDSNHNAQSIPCSAAVLAAFGACLLTRRCSYLAFQKYHRSTIATNLIEEIHNSFSSLFGTS